MNLQQIAKKYKISESFLSSKEDGLIVGSKSIKEIIRELEHIKGSEQVIIKLKKLHDFLIEIKNTTIS